MEDTGRDGGRPPGHGRGGKRYRRRGPDDGRGVAAVRALAGISLLPESQESVDGRLPDHLVDGAEVLFNMTRTLEDR